MIKRLIISTYLLLLLDRVYAQPATEIVLFDITMGTTAFTATNGVNISAHTGYDNQPFFHPDKPILYYTSANEAGNTEIVQYDYVSKQKVILTKTPDNEYSPTVTPDKRFISCIVLRENDKQDVVKYPIDGGRPTTIIDNLTVGYHAWLNDSTLMLYVLGEPNTLRRYDIATKSDKILATNIGRSLHRFPNRSGVSFVQKTKDDNWIVSWTDGVDSRFIAHTLPGREDLAWTSDQWLVMSDGKAIFVLQAGKEWVKIEIQSAYPLKNISRIAVDVKTKKLAVVTDE